MKNKFTIFYSWQSDIRKNKNLIANCLNKAVKEVIKKQNKDIRLEINIDRDTKDKSGSPEIAQIIFNKIDTADIFIGDVTPINNSFISRLLRNRLTPNPNVLIELGYAVNNLGWDRIISILDTRYSTTDDLPFDIRGHRLTTFNSTDVTSKENLTAVLRSAIESIVRNYDSILSDRFIHSNKKHDLDIFDKVNIICNETALFESFSSAISSLFVNQDILDKWDGLQEFYKLVINHFIDDELNELMVSFLQELNDFDTIIATNFHLIDRKDETYLSYLSRTTDGEKLSAEDEFEWKQIQRYMPNKEPFAGETYPEKDKRIHKLQDKLYEQGVKVRTAYTQLIRQIKIKLL